MSLLGAVAYLAHTRIDVVVFICALQRHTSKPQVQHVKKLNKLLSWVQKNPRKLVYRRFAGGDSALAKGTHLRAVSDAAYKKEVDDGYSLRGAVFCNRLCPLLGAVGRALLDCIYQLFSASSMCDTSRKLVSIIGLLAWWCTDEGGLLHTTGKRHMISELAVLDQL